MTMHNIPGTYRFTEGDVDEAWRLFASQYEDGSPELSDDQQEFIALTHCAEQMQRQSRVYPTLDEAVAEHRRRYAPR
jgi:hypothetical protein